MWDNRRDCTNQLVGTVVRKGKNAVTVEAIRGQGRDLVASVCTLATKRTSAVRVDELDLKPVKLGYINTRQGTRYLTRIPMRRWKHGLDSNNVDAIGIRGQRVNFDIRSHSRALAACIRGQYPVFDECIDTVEQDGTSRAFSRNFALRQGSSRIEVYYKGRKVGHVGGNRNVVLDNRYQYLNELLGKDIND